MEPNASLLVASLCLRSTLTYLLTYLQTL